jgi:hydrogenase-4 component E
VTELFDLILVIVALADLALLGMSRLATCIRLVAIQAMVLSFLPLLSSDDGIGLRVLLFAVGVFVLKGLVFPWLLMRILRTADVRHEVEPYIGYAPSILLGALILGNCFWFASEFKLPRPTISPLVLPIAFATILIGLLLIVSRRTALSQVIGYLVLENGIFVFGAALALDVPFVVEIGVLLDVFVAVFVMGIAIFHISREFDHIDVDQLSLLKE